MALLRSDEVAVLRAPSLAGPCALLACALVCERGSALSDAAGAARARRIACVVAVCDAARHVATGAAVSVACETRRGSLTRLDVRDPLPLGTGQPPQRVDKYFARLGNSLLFDPARAPDATTHDLAEHDLGKRTGVYAHAVLPRATDDDDASSRAHWDMISTCTSDAVGVLRYTVP